MSVIQEKGSPEQIQRARTGGKGNTVNAIYHEITTKSKETKVCNKCGNESPPTNSMQVKMFVNNAVTNRREWQNL